MIFYFSGTGNSLYAAKNIAENNKEQLISIAAAMSNGDKSFEYTLKEDEVIGFVYPIYAWGPPKMVIDFIEKLKLINNKSNYVFTVATCGDNIGNAVKLLGKVLDKKGLPLNSAFSIRMPNNYIIMGNVDKKEREEKKLSEADKQLENINKVISEKQKGVYQIVKGFMPMILTSVVNPMFNKHAMDTKKFYVNEKCTGCGLCEKVCNCQNIAIKDKKPVWSDKCSQCLACLHYCPTRAVQYGKGTEVKGRYTNPRVKVSEMTIKQP
jgi:flavodoxin/NAD-dependent dihydropyrimidine dehydrogenase PreA subunit